MRRPLRPQLRSLCSLMLLLLPPRIPLAALPAVPTPHHAATNFYHGTQVVDDYQWLEQATNAEVREWTRLQNERTAAYFERLPFRLTVAEALKQMSEETSANYSSRRKRGNRKGRDRKSTRLNSSH